MDERNKFFSTFNMTTYNRGFSVDFRSNQLKKELNFNDGNFFKTFMTKNKIKFPKIENIKKEFKIKIDETLFKNHDKKKNDSQLDKET